MTIDIQSTQSRIIHHIDSIVRGFGFETSLSPNYSNSGSLQIFEPGKMVACGSIGYAFQHDSYTCQVKMRGALVPSQEGRSDYHDFRQAYDESTRLFDVIEDKIAEVAMDLGVRRPARRP
jgi:hypothetical protein